MFALAQLRAQFDKPKKSVNDNIDFANAVTYFNSVYGVDCQSSTHSEQQYTTKFSYTRSSTEILNKSCCPGGYILLWVCNNCNIVNRGNVFCSICKTKFIKRCKSKDCQANCSTYDENKLQYCYHSTRTFRRDVYNAYYYPTWAFVTDVYMHLEEHLVNYKRKDIIESIKQDKDQDTFSSLSSLNFLAIAKRLGEDHIVESIEQANEGISFPHEERCFLFPDYRNSLENSINEYCMIFSILLRIARLKTYTTDQIKELEKQFSGKDNGEGTDINGLVNINRGK